MGKSKSQLERNGAWGSLPASSFSSALDSTVVVRDGMTKAAILKYLWCNLNDALLALSRFFVFLCGYRFLGWFRAEDALEDFIHVAQLPIQVEGMVELLAREARGDLLVFAHQGAKVQSLLPGTHGKFLHDAVGVFALHAAFGQVEQKLAAEDQAAGALQVLLHALRIDEHLLDQVGGFVEQIIHEDGGIGQDHALDGRVRNIALVPESDIFERCLRMPAHHARQSADLLAGDGVALVRHGRRSLLLFAEIFLGLAHLGALQMTDLSGDLIQSRSNDGQRGYVISVAVALDDLGRDRSGFESQAVADFFFHFRIKMGEGAYGA